MDDDRVWEFEQGFWTGGLDAYRDGLDPAALMVLPMEPAVLDHDAAMAGIAGGARWTRADFSHRHVARPEQGMIVVAYRVRAVRDDMPADAAPHEAWCSSTYRRVGHDEWRLCQHQQTPIAAA